MARAEHLVRLRDVSQFLSPRACRQTRKARKVLTNLRCGARATANQQLSA